MPQNRQGKKVKIWCKSFWIYEPIEDLDIPKERLVMFLAQYNDIVRGSMNLIILSWCDDQSEYIKISGLFDVRVEMHC
jgi:hypothetical protein